MGWDGGRFGNYINTANKINRLGLFLVRNGLGRGGEGCFWMERRNVGFWDGDMQECLVG